MNNKTVRSLLLAACLAASAGSALAAGLFVIANAEVTLSTTDLKEVYLGDKQFAGQVHLVPVDNAVAQVEFLRRALAMEQAKYNTTWTKKGFREGLNPPAIKSSDLEVIEFVKRTPGAIGYVTTPPPASVTVILKY